MVSYEKGQRREHDIEVDESKPVVAAVQDVEIIVVAAVALALFKEKASLGLIRLDRSWGWNLSRKGPPWGSAGYRTME